MKIIGLAAVCALSLASSALGQAASSRVGSGDVSIRKAGVER